jgi:hypothetical protein
MPQVCKVCRHKDREPIEKALLAREPYRTIADRYGMSKTALIRHNAAHLPASLRQSHEAEEMSRADRLLLELRIGGERIEMLFEQSELMAARAAATGDVRTAIKAIQVAAILLRESREHLELRARLTGEIEAEQRPPVYGTVFKLPGVTPAPLPMLPEG